MIFITLIIFLVNNIANCLIIMFVLESGVLKLSRKFILVYLISIRLITITL